MKIKMNSLVITNYSNVDKRKYRFINDISNDPLINIFVGNNIRDLVKASEVYEELEVGPGYIIENKRKLVGLIRLASLDGNGTVDLHYAVHPDYRKHSYGTTILKETSKYILKNMKSVNKIELHIRNINLGSIKCAERANFKFDRECNFKCDSSIKVYSIKR